MNYQEMKQKDGIYLQTAPDKCLSVAGGDPFIVVDGIAYGFAGAITRIETMGEYDRELALRGLLMETTELEATEGGEFEAKLVRYFEEETDAPV